MRVSRSSAAVMFVAVFPRSCYCAHNLCPLALQAMTSGCCGGVGWAHRTLWLTTIETIL
jgi:hypothetical protein